ncbi:MAG: hypothetical protein WC444_06765 [Candidatus Paceibacterota bacterium]
MAYTTITFGGVTIYAENILETSVPATRKQLLGKRLVMNEVFADAWDFRFVISGIIIGSATTIDSARTDLRALRDGLKHAYTDGNSERNGNYIVEDLTFFDDSKTAATVTNLRYNMTIIQDQYD